MQSLLEISNGVKIDINPKTELFKWGPIAFKLIYGVSFIDTILLQVPKHYPWPWPPGLCLFEKGKMVWINEYPAIADVGLKYFKKYFLNPANYQGLWRKWQEWIVSFKKKAQTLEKIDLGRLSEKELIRQFKDFYQFNIDLWLIVHVPEVVNIGANYYFRNKLKDIFGEESVHYLEILVAPIDFSFLQQEELELLQIALIKDKTSFEKALAKHAQKYHWLLNGYGGTRFLTKDYFQEKLKSLLQGKSSQERIEEIKDTVRRNKERKEDLVKKIKLGKELVLESEKLTESIHWQDSRKVYFLQLDYYWDKFLAEVSKRSNWAFRTLLWCWPQEIIKIVAREKVNRKEVKRRKNYYLIFAKEGWLKDSTDKGLVKEMFHKYMKAEVSGVNEFKGLVVSKGKEAKVRGRVKIVLDPFSEGSKFKQGDILVATMTEPEFVIVMRKAKAVITDEGGITCHAAIISRELGIPCIVSTKIATQVLKDGDIVEVNADDGMVTIIKKA